MNSEKLQLFYDQHTALFALLLFITYLVMHNDIVHEKFLSQIEGATIGNYTTTYGTICQGLMFVLVYMGLVIISSII